MTDSAPATPATIDNDELLARFVFFNRWVREDRTVRPDAFVPHPHADLSVTRHIGMSETELWQQGEIARGTRQAPLIGRADVMAGDVRSQTLQIRPDEPPRNHAIIVGWLGDKPGQKIKAQAIAAAARYRAYAA